jgi:hypothetical protein
MGVHISLEFKLVVAKALEIDPYGGATPGKLLDLEGVSDDTGRHRQSPSECQSVVLRLCNLDAADWRAPVAAVKTPAFPSPKGGMLT